MARSFHNQSDGPQHLAAAVNQVTGMFTDWVRVDDPEKADVLIRYSPDSSLEGLKSNKDVLHVIVPGSNVPESLKAEYPDHYHPASVIDPEGPALIIRVAELAKKFRESGEVEQEENRPALSPSPVHWKRIAVIDDTATHLDSARQQFAHSNRVHLFQSYSDFLNALSRGDIEKPDIVLSDMMMPAEATTLSPDATNRYLGQSLAAGALIPMAAARNGIPLIVVQTDAGHHDHPALAMLDFVGWDQPIRVEDSQIIFTHASKQEGVKDWAIGLSRALELCSEES